MEGRPIPHNQQLGHSGTETAELYSLVRTGSKLSLALGGDILNCQKDHRIPAWQRLPAQYEDRPCPPL